MNTFTRCDQQDCMCLYFVNKRNQTVFACQELRLVLYTTNQVFFNKLLNFTPVYTSGLFINFYYEMDFLFWMM